MPRKKELGTPLASSTTFKHAASTVRVGSGARALLALPTTPFPKTLTYTRKGSSILPPASSPSDIRQLILLSKMTHKNSQGTPQRIIEAVTGHRKQSAVTLKHLERYLYTFAF